MNHFVRRLTVNPHAVTFPYGLQYCEKVTLKFSPL